MASKKILLIDDEKGFCSFLKENLELRGYEVFTVNDGIEGIKLAIDTNPDLIIIDIVMPYMQGDSVARQLKDNNETKDIPIIFLTAAATEDEVNSNEGIIGGYPFISKPVKEAELLVSIEKYIRK